MGAVHESIAKTHTARDRTRHRAVPCSARAKGPDRQRGFDMIQQALVALLALAPISNASSNLAILAAGAAQAGGKAPEAPDKRPEVASMIEKLDKHVDKHGAEDADAITLVGQLAGEFTKSGPKDKSSIVTAMGKCIEAPRTEPKKGEFNDKLAIAAADVLGQMGPESVATLITWIGNKNVRRDIALQRQLVLSLGKTRDKEGIKTLTLSLENKDAPVVAAAAEAIGEFGDAKLDVRKELFSSVLKNLMSAKNAKDAESQSTGGPKGSIATERYDTVAAPLMTTLHKLTKHDESTPEGWEHWWNKNRQANWDSSKP
jgi:hypothetical protein